MNQSKKKKRNLIILTCILSMLCLAAGAWLLLFSRNTDRDAGRTEASTVAAEVISEIDRMKNESDRTVQGFLENWLLAEHVYPHGHTNREDEHTFDAYDDAIRAGAHYIEPDIVISGDGTLYVSHDMNAARITGVNRYYANMSNEDIDSLRGLNGEKILKLSDVLDKYGKSVRYLIELKSADKETINAFRTELDKYGLAEYVILQSVYPEVLETAESYYPDMPKLLVVKNSEALNLALSADYIDIVGARIQYMTQDNCDAAHNAGKKFVGWPINTESEIVNAIRMGADAYFTDDTELALKLEKKYRKDRVGERETIIFASDYQEESGFERPEETFKAVLSSAITDGEKPDAAVLCGDYTNDSRLHDYQLSGENAIEEIRSVLHEEAPYLKDDNMVFIQGNHDRLTDSITASGLHEYKSYLLYVLNTENDFPWKQGRIKGSYEKVKTAAEEMEKCFNELIEKGETRPVFIIGHVPLHFTARTSSRHTTGDNLYSSLIFDVANKGADSLDIVYLYGHNHSKGWDCYMGGSSVFKAKGDSLLIPVHEEGATSSDRFEEKTLKFTYMNAGYVGYYMNCAPGEEIKAHKSADETLTCSAIDIYKDRIEIRRYDETGPHILGAAGAGNPYKGGIDEGLIDSKYYSKEIKGPAIIERKQAVDYSGMEEKEAA